MVISYSWYRFLSRYLSYVIYNVDVIELYILCMNIININNCFKAVFNIWLKSKSYYVIIMKSYITAFKIELIVIFFIFYYFLNHYYS